jgi:zinc finger protein BrlA
MKDLSLVMLSEFTMFVDRKPEYLSSTQPDSPPSCLSMTSSFSEPWEASGTTPATPQRSSGHIKLEGEHISSVTPFYTTPEKFGGGLDYSQLSNISEESMSGFSHIETEFFGDMKASSGHSFMMYNNLPEYDGTLLGATSCHGLPSGAPSLDLDTYSPSGSGSSSVSTDFVVPSQTTFVSTLDFQSPMWAVGAIHFDLPYESPISSHFAPDFPLDNSPTKAIAGNMTYFIPQSFDYKSASATPQKPSNFRQPICSSLPSSAALRRVTNLASPSNTHSNAKSNIRRKMKREVRESMLPSGIRVQKVATQRCEWEGCQRRFERKEHLRRHEKIHLGNEAYPCIFCEKVFNRCDNLKQHIELHTQPKKKAKRTKHFPEAQKVYAEMNSKKRRTVHTPVFQ